MSGTSRDTGGSLPRHIPAAIAGGERPGSEEGLTARGEPVRGNESSPPSETDVEQLDDPVLLESDEQDVTETGGGADAGDDEPFPPDPMFHWVHLAMAVGVVLLAFVLRVRGEHHVLLPGFNQPLPEVCTFKRYFGMGCPGCGLTRSLISLADGDVARAWHFNPVGLGVAALFAVQIPYRLLQLWRLRRGLPEWNARRLGTWTLLLLSIGLFAQWILRLLGNAT